MKVILEENQVKRVIKQIAEIKKARTLLAARKAGVSANDESMENTPNRYRPYDRQRAGIEEQDLSDNFYTEDNSDPQLS